MSAIIKYFNHIRQIKERNREVKKRHDEKIKEIQLEIVEVVPKSRRDYIDDSLYNRVHDEDINIIINVICTLNNDEIDYVLKKRNTYSTNVQQAIHEIFDPVEFVRVSPNRKVRPIDDYELFKIQQKREQDYETKLESDWQTYKLKHNLIGPVLDVYIDHLEKLKVDLETSQLQLKNYPRRYVPPGATRPLDQPFENLKLAITKIENEIKLKTEEIKTLDKHWNEHEKRKYEFNR